MSMDIVIKILGIVFVCLGILYFLKPQFLKRFMLFFKKGKRLYLVALSRFALAVVFLVGANQCHRFWVIFAFGIIFIISGMLLFIMRLEKLRAIIDWYQSQPNWIFRVISLIAVAFGVAIIFSA